MAAYRRVDGLIKVTPSLYTGIRSGPNARYNEYVRENLLEYSSTFERAETESKAIRTGRMQRERNDRENGEENARNQEIDDVVDGLAFQLHDERHTSERRLVTVVPVLRILHWNACMHHTDACRPFGNDERRQ